MRNCPSAKTARLSLFLTKKYLRKSINGFTLIELLIVIAILGILSTFFVSQFPSSQKRGRDTVRKSDIQQYQTAVEVYANKKNGSYPTATKAMDDVCDDAFSAGLGLTTCPKDPKGVSYSYVSLSSGTGYYIWGALEDKSASGNNIWFVVCSNGKSGIKESTAPTGTSCPI